MRTVCLVILAATLASFSAWAQPANRSGTTDHTRRSYGAPLDHGPFTPEASRAFQGGGMILQGEPGAPAPMPEPTAPGQTPRNIVPLTGTPAR